MSDEARGRGGAPGSRGRGQSWAALGGTLLGGTVAAACVPKVPATIVIDETRPPKAEEGERARAEPKPAKPGPEHGPPKIVRAELIGATSLRLHFSEAIGSSEDVDPRDFRVSFLRRYANQRTGYFYAYYYDPGFLNYGIMFTPSRVRVREDQLDLEFTPELGQAFCRQLDYNYNYNHTPPGVDTDAALFVHYAAGEIPIRDADGEPLAEVGARWVELGRGDSPQARVDLNGAEASRAGADLVELECGPPIPPGPR